MIEHGDRVKDKISGLKGIVVGITTWLYGCRRISVQPESAKDNRPADMFVVDEPQLILLKKTVIAPISSEIVLEKFSRKHGPRENVVPRNNVNK